MDIKHILEKIAEPLSGVSGVVGVVLGGSRARGTNRIDSDIDIGIYYDLSKLDLSKINSIATELDDYHRENIITPIGGWGEWVNAGGWLVIDGVHVDFILRDIKRVEQVICDSIDGKISAHYHWGHPHAYINVMYMGELAICKILVDINGQLQALKAKTIPYPSNIKKAVIEKFLPEAEFSLTIAENNAGNDDIYYVAGHIFRVISCINQVLFAVNEEYCINEKKAVKMIAGFSKVPCNYKERVDEIFSSLSHNPNECSIVCRKLRALVEEVRLITQ
ncbi:putative nucleotidyltransferase [Caldicoprobacter guelmensis]|uniref:nucleotidyltransferase domain-containing protein n=1 Tax=Caldicoprobacter guelmensis TaxID=1170224 RepID=UPI001FAF7786|nr:nucleotidyltransferase domain-containing protein [Caldicoprobacter guelmensis]MBM7581602.1 putative nucleotidyltransferase [Caldicoprobacter guelmensis]